MSLVCAHYCALYLVHFAPASCRRCDTVRTSLPSVRSLPSETCLSSHEEATHIALLDRWTRPGGATRPETRHCFRLINEQLFELMPCPPPFSHTFSARRQRSNAFHFINTPTCFRPGVDSAALNLLCPFTAPSITSFGNPFCCYQSVAGRPPFCSAACPNPENLLTFDVSGGPDKTDRYMF